jgi:geranylgeranyl reductase family protein
LTYDIFIIGGGPSGSLTAYLLAKKGLKVCIIDKASFPREKICAGGIPKKALRLLDFDCLSIAHKKITSVCVTYKNEDKILLKNKTGEAGYTFLRSEFDEFLINKAINQGSVFYDNCEYLSSDIDNDIITVKTSKGLFKTTHLVGADGVLSKVRELHFKERIQAVPVIEALVYVPEYVLDLYEDIIVMDLGIHKRGYAWIFPKRDHLNVGLYSMYRSRDYMDIHLKTFNIPVTPVKNPRSGNIWLSGDAAGFVETIFGEGIYFAFKSAIITAEAIDSVMANNDPVHYYARLSKEIQTQLRYSKIAAWWFFNFQKFGFYQIVRNSYLNQLFSGFLSDETSYRKCLKKMLLTFPFWIFQHKERFTDIRKDATFL